jgi:hypothetical protein
LDGLNNGGNGEEIMKERRYEKCWECGKDLHLDDEILIATFYSSKRGFHSTMGFCDHGCFEKTEMRAGMTMVGYHHNTNVKDY